MSHDRPEPPTPAPRGALDDLRERLARLPSGHPSAAGFDRPARGPAPHAPGAEHGAARARASLPDGPMDRGPADEQWPGDPVGPLPGPALPGPARPTRPAVEERLRRLDRLARALGPARPRESGHVTDTTAAPAALDNGWRPGTREPYRPWFSSDEPYRPWFSSGEPYQPWFSEAPHGR